MIHPTVPIIKDIIPVNIDIPSFDISHNEKYCPILDSVSEFESNEVTESINFHLYKY